MRKYIFIIILLLAISYAPYAAMAQVKLEVGLPNLPGGQIPAGSEFPTYIKYLFLFGLGLITIIALAQMMIGGLKYILAAGNVGTTEDAKKQIQQALIGMAVILLSYLLLNIINPDLVSLRNPGLVPLDLKITQFPITGPAANKATYQDVINSPDGTVFIPSSGHTISHSGDSIVDCVGAAPCAIHKISDLEKLKPSEPLFKEPIIAP